MTDARFDVQSLDSLSVCATSVITEPVHRSEADHRVEIDETGLKTSETIGLQKRESSLSSAEVRRADALEEILQRGKFDGLFAKGKRHSFPADSPARRGKSVRFASPSDGEEGTDELKAEISRLIEANASLKKKEATASLIAQRLKDEQEELEKAHGELKKDFDRMKGQKSEQKVGETVDSLERLLGMADDGDGDGDDDSSQLSTIAEDAEGEKQIAALQEEKDQLDGQLHHLQRDLKEERTRRLLAEKERDALKSKIHSHEEDIYRLQRENDMYRREKHHQAHSREGSTEPTRPAFPAIIPSGSRPSQPSRHVTSNPQLAMSMPDVAKVAQQSEGFKPYNALASSNTSLSHGSLNALSPYGSESNLDGDGEHFKLSQELQRSVAESLRGGSNMQQILQAVLSHSNSLQSDRMRQSQLEKDRLKARLFKAESEIDLLRLNLAESKDFAERYSLTARQLESNATTLSACLAFTTKVIHIYEKVIALLEAEESVVMVACRISKMQNPRELVHSAVKPGWSSAGAFSQETVAAARHATARLRSAETDARELLQGFDTYGSPTHEGEVGSSTSGYSSDTHFWEEKSQVFFSRTSSSSTNGSGCGLPSPADTEPSHDVLAKLKDHVISLKLQRTKKERALVEVEPEGFPDMPRHSAYFNHVSQIDRDFEHALLLLELATVKDDKVDLKAKTYLQEQELRSYELQTNTFTAQEQSYLVHIEHLKAEVKEQTRKKRRLQKDIRELQGRRPDTPAQEDRQKELYGTLSISRTMSLDRPTPAGSSNPSLSQPSGDPQIVGIVGLQKELAEAQRRERALRLRNHEMVESMEHYAKSVQAESTQQQLYEKDLKRAHDSLVAAYNKLKRRFQLQQKAHEEEIASLRREIIKIQSEKDKFRYLEFSQEETQL